MASEEPIARRRTPRKAAAAAAAKWHEELGLNNKRSTGTAANPPAEASTAKAAAAPTDDAAAPTAKAPGGYGAWRVQYPTLAGMLEGACLGFGGDVTVQLAVKGQAFDGQRATIFMLWGAMVTLLVGPFQRALRSRTLSSAGAVDAALKGLIGQLSLGPVLTAVFIGYFSCMRALQTGEAVSASAVVDQIVGAFAYRYAIAASFWLIGDSLNYALVPARHGQLFTSTLGALWAVIQSIITP